MNRFICECSIGIAEDSIKRSKKVLMLTKNLDTTKAQVQKYIGSYKYEIRMTRKVLDKSKKLLKSFKKKKKMR